MERKRKMKKKITHSAHSEHPLRLVSYKGGEKYGMMTSAEECAGCRETIEQVEICYGCRICGFYLHRSCALEHPQQLQSFFHPCNLSLRITSFGCNACFETRTGFSYRCEPCDFDLDVDCARQLSSSMMIPDDGEKEQTLHHFSHRHPLQLSQETSPFEGFLCRICDKLSSSGPFWGCEPCHFHAHCHCLALLPQKVQAKLDSELVSFVLVTSPSKKCLDCGRVSDLAFRGSRATRLCISCCLVRRMVDESPSPLPKVMDHFLHPCPVNLVFSPFSTCNACFRNHHHHRREFFYHCKDCDFFLDLECVQPPPTLSHADQIQHFCHPHRLELVRELDDNQTLCKLCDNPCSESLYGCSQCQFYVHKACMEILPQKTNHRLLDKSIVLLPVPSFKCTTCNQACSGLTYLCSETRCNFCVKCVMWPDNEFGQNGGFKSIHHWHQLTIGEPTEQAPCFMCGEYCSSETYNCSPCNIFFHKQCAELPREIQIPLHPKHPLALTNMSPHDKTSSPMKCSLCWKDLSSNLFGYNGFYHCTKCDFKLDSLCACRLPSLRCQHHVHRLTIVESFHGTPDCDVCYMPVTGIVLRCGKCYYYCIHLECGPLPCTIKSSFHVHSLTLEDYYVEDNEADKFACHICEEERDPRHPAYCCKEGCLMICEVKCLVSQVLPMLRGEHGYVETRTVYPNVAGEIISKEMVLEEMKMMPTSEQGGARHRIPESELEFSYHNLYDSFINSAIKEDEEEEEEETLDIASLEAGYEQNDSQSTTRRIKEEDKVSNQKDGRQGVETSYLYSSEALSSFQQHLRPPTLANLYKPWPWDYVGRMTGEYELPPTLHPLYEQLFGKHNNIIADDKRKKLSYPKKRYLIFMLCVVMDQMRKRKVVDVIQDVILNWLGWIRYVEMEGGLDLRFVVERIERIWKAHFVIRAKRLVDKKSMELSQELEKLSQKEEELAKELEATRTKILEKKKEETVHKAYRASGASSLKKHYKDALEIKWRPCFDCARD